MRGTPSYTQHTVAWPQLPLHGRPDAYDEISISWDAKDGGTYGGFSITFGNFGPMNDWDTREHPYVKIECFTDGINVLLQPETKALFAWISKMPYESRNEITPAKMIKKLEKVGFKASSYHLQNA